MYKKNVYVSLSTIIMAGSLLAACSKEGAAPAGSAGNDPAKAEPPTEVSIMTSLFTPEAPAADNVVQKELEKRTNTKMKINWVPNNNYQDKLNVTLASGDLPDLILIADVFHPQVRTLAAQGAFWDITPFVKDYPNLAAWPKEVWTNTKMEDGKNYGVPRVRPVDGGGGLMVRKDWLDKLGLQPPKTMDELYAVMKAFAEKDPDGNGKNDTYGLTGSGTFGWAENVFNKTNGAWMLKDGRLLHTVFEPGTKTALTWLNKAFTEKLIPADLAILKTTQTEDMITQSKAGIISAAINTRWKYVEPLRKVVPNADMLPLVSLDGGLGAYAPKDSGFNGMYAIPKKVPEAKVKKILAMLNYGVSEEGHVIANYGIKDVHYTVKDGEIISNSEAQQKDIIGQGVFGQIFAKYDKYLRSYFAGSPLDVINDNKKIIDERAKYGVADAGTGLYSETYNKLGKDYDKKIEDMKIKIIMGKEPLSAWDEFISKLKADASFQKMITETNQAYEKRNTSK